MGKVLALYVVTVVVTTTALGVHQDGPVDISSVSPVQIVLGAAMPDAITNGTTSTKDPQNLDKAWVMGVGSSYIVQDKTSTAFTDSLRNKTSSSPSFMPKACEKFDYCVQSFQHGERSCDGPPVAQEGIGKNMWTMVERKQEGCQDEQKQTCEIWEEYFIEVRSNGDTMFKWESMSGGTPRKTIIPPVKVSQTGKCFNKCELIRHPTVQQIAEPKLIVSQTGYPHKIVEFAQAAGCTCCDFEVFLPDGVSCRNFELDALDNKTWVLAEQVDGAKYTQGPICHEYHKKAPIVEVHGIPVDIPALNMPALQQPGQRNALLVDDEAPLSAHLTEDEIEQLPDIDPSSETSEQLNIAAVSPPPPAPVPPPQRMVNGNGDIWQPPVVPFVRDPSIDKMIDDEQMPDDEHHDEPGDAKGKAPKMTPAIRKEIESIQVYTAVPDELPTPDFSKSSLNKNLHVTVNPPPSPPPPPPPRKRKEQFDLSMYKRGSEYTPDMKPTPFASQLNDTKHEATAMAMITDIGHLLESESEKKEHLAKELAEP